MNLLLQFTFLGLLCLHGQGQTLKRQTQNEQWKELNQLQNRELFLSALQSYFSAKGIHMERTAPAFVLTSSNRDMVTQRMEEEQEMVVLDHGMDD